MLVYDKRAQIEQGTIGTRKEIHILHRKDKLIPPVKDFLEHATRWIIHKILFSVRYEYVLVDTFLQTGTRFGDTFPVTAPILVYNSVQPYSPPHIACF